MIKTATKVVVFLVGGTHLDNPFILGCLKQGALNQGSLVTLPGVWSHNTIVDPTMDGKQEKYLYVPRKILNIIIAL